MPGLRLPLLFAAEVAVGYRVKWSATGAPRLLADATVAQQRLDKCVAAVGQWAAGPSG